MSGIMGSNSRKNGARCPVEKGGKSDHLGRDVRSKMAYCPHKRGHVLKKRVTCPENRGH